ncbi:hypothetical protein AB4Z54_32920, partial [Streptomyces sp. MCAF7]
LTDEVRRFRRSVFAEAMAEWPEADRAEFARLLTDFVGALGRAGAGSGAGSGARRRGEPSRGSREP